MNLRILKKLSARAAPLLPKLGDKRQQFRAEKCDNCTGVLIRDRKHFERMRSPHSEPSSREGSIKVPARDGRGYIAMWPPSSPRKGTMMVGAVSGYYEPEWDEETAWEALRTFVHYEMADFDESGPVIWPTFKHPGEIFAAAERLIAQRAALPPADHQPADGPKPGQ